MARNRDLDKAEWLIPAERMKMRRPHLVPLSQQAVTVKNASRAAYNFAEYLDERRAMMQQWADYLDKLKAGAEVITLPDKAA